METSLLNIIEDTQPQAKAQRYLLQIHRIKLIDYISYGLIVPDRHLGEDIEKDIQSKNPNLLAVSEGYIDELDEYQILLELILTDDEVERLYEVDDLYYFDKPLPITRIKKVYVQDKNIVKHMNTQIQNSENGFLPNELFEAYIKSKKPIFEKKQYSASNNESSEANYEEQIRYFDKRMGMFCFMKNTELYYSSSTQEISNYSKHYFGILSSLLKEPLDNMHLKDLDVLKHNKTLKILLYSDKQIDKDFIVQESQKIEDNELKEIFLQLLQPTGTREILTKLHEKKELEFFLIGLVYYFRQKNNSNKKDNFKVDIQNLIPYEWAEVSLAILGIYFGYKNLRSQEKIELKDHYFKKIFGDTFSMKFTFESKLDYITVETIYNICFKDKEHKGYEYEYLPYPTKKPKAIKIPEDKRFKIWHKSECKIYFEKEHVSVKKLSKLEAFGNLLGKYSDEIVESKKSSYLIAFVQYNFGDILTFDNKGQKYFTKDALLKKLEILEDENISDELINVLGIRKD